MPIAAQDIVDRVTDLLLDKDRADDDARWTDAELLRWINDSRMAIITRRPQAGAVVTVMSLADGSLQSTPDDCIELLDVIRNMGTDGATPGRSIRRIDRQNLDDDDPYWHAGAKKREVSQFTFDDRVPSRFYVYPPAMDGTKVEVSIAKNPEALTAITGATLGFPIQYLDAVVNYVCYRAKSKDSQYANAAEAAAYYAAFNDALGTQAESQSNTSPNQPGNSV